MTGLHSLACTSDSNSITFGAPIRSAIGVGFVIGFLQAVNPSVAAVIPLPSPTATLTYSTSATTAPGARAFNPDGTLISPGGGYPGRSPGSVDATITGNPFFPPLPKLVVGQPAGGTMGFTAINPFPLASTFDIVYPLTVIDPAGAGSAAAADLVFDHRTQNVVDGADETLTAFIAAAMLFHLAPPAGGGSFGALSMNYQISLGGVEILSLGALLATDGTGPLPDITDVFVNVSPCGPIPPQINTFSFIAGMSPITGGDMVFMQAFGYPGCNILLDDGATIDVHGAMTALLDPAFIEIVPLNENLLTPEELEIFQNGNQAFKVTAVPEPGTAILVLIPLTALAFSRRRIRTFAHGRAH